MLKACDHKCKMLSVNLFVCSRTHMRTYAHTHAQVHTCVHSMYLCTCAHVQTCTHGVGWMNLSLIGCCEAVPVLWGKGRDMCGS